MLTSSRTAIALLILVAFASPISAAQDKKPTVSLKAVAIKHVALTDQTAETIVTIEIENSGPAYKIKDASYKLKLNGQAVAEGNCKEDIQVPADSSVTVELPVTVSLSALPEVTWSAITDGLKLNYELETEFTVPVFATFNYKVKTAFTGELPAGSFITSFPGKLVDRIFNKP